MLDQPLMDKIVSPEIHQKRFQYFESICFRFLQGKADLFDAKMFKIYTGLDLNKESILFLETEIELSEIKILGAQFVRKEPVFEPVYTEVSPEMGGYFPSDEEI